MFQLSEQYLMHTRSLECNKHTLFPIFRWDKGLSGQNINTGLCCDCCEKRLTENPLKSGPLSHWNFDWTEHFTMSNAVDLINITKSFRMAAWEHDKLQNIKTFSPKGKRQTHVHKKYLTLTWSRLQSFCTSQLPVWERWERKKTDVCFSVSYVPENSWAVFLVVEMRFTLHACMQHSYIHSIL